MITPWSLFSATLWFSLCAGLLFTLRRKTGFLMRYGVIVWSFSMVFTVVRLLFPLDDRHIFVLRSYYVLPAVYNALCYEPVPGLSVGALLIALWIVGALVGIALALCGLLRDAWRLHRSLRLPAPAPIREAAQQCGTDPNLVRVSSAVSSPMTAGLLHPMIYFPVIDYPDAALPCILKHESCHIAGHDAWVKLGFLLFRCVFWWNPLMYFAERSVHDILELRCDQAALADASAEEQLAYAQAISATAQQALQSARSFTGAASFVQPQDTDFLVLRTKLVLEAPCPSKWRVRSMLALSLALFLFSYSFIFLPAIFPDFSDGEPEMFQITPETAYLVESTPGEYQLWCNGVYLHMVPADELSEERYQNLEVRP